MSGPDRIWHAIDRNGKISGCPDAHVMPCADVQKAYTEYVRAYLCAPQDARVQALEAENARLRSAADVAATIANGALDPTAREATLRRDLSRVRDYLRAALRDLEGGGRVMAKRIAQHEGTKG